MYPQFSVGRVPLLPPTRLPTLSTSTIFVVLLAAAAHAQQAIDISPFVAYSSESGAPLAGLGVGISAGPVGVRASGYVPFSAGGSPGSVTQSQSSVWGGDADAVLSLGAASLGGSISPYLFAGASLASDNGVARQGWSYGAGLTLHLFGPLDAFGESRQRMSRYVLPTASGAPTPSSEFRVGLSLRLGAPRRSSSRDERVSVIPAGMPAGGAASNTAGARVLPTAEHYLGVPYRWGGTSPSTGFDCSGFTQYVFARHGVRLPRTSREQAQVGARMPADWAALAAGDLVMFEEGGRIGHVAIYAGRGRIIHSSSSGHGVRYDDLSTQRGHWFRDHMVAARRVTPDARGLMLDLAKGFADGIGLLLDPPDHAPAP